MVVGAVPCKSDRRRGPLLDAQAPASFGALTYQLSGSGRLGNVEANRKPRLGCQVDQRIEAEISDLSLEKIVEPGLRDPETPRGLGLRHPPASHALLDRDQQIGAHGHVGGLGQRILERIPDVCKTLTFHRHISAKSGPTVWRPVLSPFWPSAASFSETRAAHRRRLSPWLCKALGTHQRRPGCEFPAPPARCSS